MKKLLDNMPMNKSEVDSEKMKSSDDYMKRVSKEMGVSVDEMTNHKVCKSKDTMEPVRMRLPLSFYDME